MTMRKLWGNYNVARLDGEKTSYRSQLSKGLVRKDISRRTKELGRRKGFQCKILFGKHFLSNLSLRQKIRSSFPGDPQYNICPLFWMDQHLRPFPLSHPANRGHVRCLTTGDLDSNMLVSINWSFEEEHRTSLPLDRWREGEFWGNLFPLGKGYRRDHRFDPRTERRWKRGDSLYRIRWRGQPTSANNTNRFSWTGAHSSLGFIFGTKRLKAIAVREGKSISFNNPDPFFNLYISLRDRIQRDRYGMALKEEHTFSILIRMVLFGLDYFYQAFWNCPKICTYFWNIETNSNPANR